jgi:nudix-type nucleoside diphosphatase (YffH/AdpP family)
MMEEVEVISRVELLGGWSPVEEVEVEFDRLSGGRDRVKRRVVDAGDAAAVLLLDTESEEFVFVRQLRVPLLRHSDPWLLELVAGKVDAGESPEDSARREVLEEVGYLVDALQPIAQFYPSAGIQAEKIWVYFAESDRRTGGGGGDESEDLQVVRMSPEQALDTLHRGEIRDAKTLIALQWYALNRR